MFYDSLQSFFVRTNEETLVLRKQNSIRQHLFLDLFQNKSNRATKILNKQSQFFLIRNG